MITVFTNHENVLQIGNHLRFPIGKMKEKKKSKNIDIT